MQTKPGVNGLMAAAMAALFVCMLFVGYMMQYHWFPDGIIPTKSEAAHEAVVEISPITDVHVTEVMSGNHAAFADETGAYPDWIELTNVGQSAISLKDWKLSDKVKGSRFFPFPDRSIAPGEYIVVFASNSLQAEPGIPYHAPFKLSSGGDSVMLFDADGGAVESINVPALGTDQSYALGQDGNWVITAEYTPGLANTPDNYRLLTDRTATTPITLYISEFCASNQTGVKDANGEHHDWVELYNAGSESVSLKGYALTDDPADLKKWIFPDATIAAGQTMVVFLTGVDANVDGELHASFRLAAEGESLVLLDANGKILSQATFDNRSSNTSMVRSSDGDYRPSSSPTPGQANP